MLKRNVGLCANYFHKLSTTDQPQHALCPAGKDSWCGYNKATAENKSYDHKYILPCDVMLQIMSIYQALTNPEILKNFYTVIPRTQNESFNNVVWAKIPKRAFVRLDSLKLGAYDAVLYFTDGQSSKLSLQEARPQYV